MLKNLRRVRLERRLSQRALAQLVGLKQQQIALYERGLNPTDPRHVTALAEALGVEPRVLIADNLTTDAAGNFFVATGEAANV